MPEQPLSISELSEIEWIRSILGNYWEEDKLKSEKQPKTDQKALTESDMMILETARPTTDSLSSVWYTACSRL